MSRERIILLVDMNAFFASVEQQCNPFLKGRPVAVGNSSRSRSVVAAASYESRPYGIKSGMPAWEALERCPELILIAGDMRKYVDVSHRVFRICSDYTDMLEIYSIDECFLDVTHSHHLFGGPVEIARQIKQRIRRDLGLTCSVGIAPNKVLAKLAAEMQKPDGLTEIRREQVKGLLENLPVQELHGVGKAVAQRLARLGIATAGELGKASIKMLKQEFGVYGDVLHAMGNGEYDSPVVPYYDQPDIKSVGHSHTLARNTRSWHVLSVNLLRLSEMVGRRLRKQRYAGRTVTLVLRYSDFSTFTRRKSLPEYLDDGYAIYLAALSILKEQYSNKKPIRLLGVCVSNLVKGTRQLKLFENERYRKLIGTMDSINDRYGEFAITRASLLNMPLHHKVQGLVKSELKQLSVSA